MLKLVLPKLMESSAAIGDTLSANRDTFSANLHQRSYERRVRSVTYGSDGARSATVTRNAWRYTNMALYQVVAARDRAREFEELSTPYRVLRKLRAS
ncbi:MAG TPA: hypothetical protein VK638_39630 [Edaphobacter sp.]|nr:hypothetical protein [Edaphobacter sp.]